jgi:hypothetical protein
MAVVYNSTLKNNRMQLVSDLVAGKTAVASSGSASAGQLVIGTSALSGATGVLATLPLDPVPFTVAGGVATLDCTPPLTIAASGSGTAALAEFRTSAGATVVSGLTVGVGSGDIQLGTTTITAGGTVTITAGSITHG